MDKTSKKISNPHLIDDQALDIFRRVSKKCTAEIYDGVKNVNRPWVRASIYSGLSINYLKKIHREAHPDLYDESRNRKHLIGRNVLKKSSRSTCKSIVFNIDDFDRHTVHQCVENFFHSHPKREWTPLLFERYLREALELPKRYGNIWSLLTKMGYYSSNCDDMRLFTLEDQENVNLRKLYLEKIEKYRDEGRNIFFIDETWLDNTQFKPYWRIEAEDDIMTDKDAKERFILIHAGSQNGFLDEAKWLFEVNVIQGELQVQMSKENFELWVKKLLIPNLPPNSVVIMDGASYHNELCPAPKRDSSKEEMLLWAKTQLKLDVSGNVNEDVLFTIIENHRTLNHPNDLAYSIDMTLKYHGHDILRIPRFMNPKFNPMMLAWQKLSDLIDKEIVEAGNHDAFCGASNKKPIIQRALSKIKPRHWLEFDSKVKAMENTYKTRDEDMKELLSIMKRPRLSELSLDD